MSETNALLSMLQLKFNIEHPSVEDSYVYGYESAKAGLEEKENPFRSNTLESEHWSDGWWAGFYNEEPLFSLNEADSSLIDPIAVANDHTFSDTIGSWLVKVLEITSVIGVAALVGYQVLDLVA